VSDIKRAVSLKFPEIYVGNQFENKIVLQNRSNALDENDDRVREAEKKFKAKEIENKEPE
jgi:hypothetical protein